MTARQTPRRVTLTVIGQTGAGKSQFLNGYLQANCFQACADPEAVTLVTSSNESLIRDEKTGIQCLRTAIDTQGLDDTRGVDAAHVQQMVEFLKAWRHGVNAFALVINGQHDRFDGGTQKLVKLINTFFNNPTFWNHVCIVFTKCYAGCDEIDKEVKETKYRKLVLKLICECQGGQITNPPLLPVFFVDSKKYNIDRETKDQYALLHAFICGLDPLPTQRVVVPNVSYLKIEKETRQNQLVNTRITGETRIQTYEDQEREKRTGFDGRTITYSEWKAIRTREKQDKSSVRTETKTECANETRDPIIRRISCGGRRYLFAGPRGHADVHVGETVTRQMQELQRKVHTDFDGHISYDDWQVVRNWTDKSERHF
jgi:hypothetical protein